MRWKKKNFMNDISEPAPTACGLINSRWHGFFRDDAARRLPLQHPHLARMVEYAAGFKDGDHLTEGFQLPFLLGGQIGEEAFLDVNLDLIAGADAVAQAVHRFEGDEVAAVNGIAIKDARVKLGDDGLNAGGVQGDGGVF